MRRSFLILSALVVAGTPAVATAQDTTPGEGLGGYVSQASAMAVSIQPVFPALLPTGDAPVEVTFGLTTANVKSGGNAFGRAAVVWPGSAASDPGPLVGTGFGQQELGALLPKWPLQAQATQDDGEVRTGAPPGASMVATGFPDAASGDSRIADIDAPRLAHVEHAASTSSSVVKDTEVVSVARVTLRGVSMFGGHVTADAIRSVSRTSSTGDRATSTGDVDIEGLRIGGVDVSVTDDGFEVEGTPPDAEQAPGAGGPFPGRSPEAQVQSVLENLGARITLFRSVGTAKGGTADRLGSGVVFSIDNPVGGQGPVPPGRFDIILASSASATRGSPLFSAGGVADDIDDVLPDRAPGGGVSLGAGPSVAPRTADSLNRLSTVGTGSGGDVVASAPARDAYRFAGIPLGLLLGLLVLAAVGARFVRNAMSSLMTPKE